MNRVKLLTILLISSLPSMEVQALEDPATIAGKEIYQACISCHGSLGQGNSELKSPALAGQLKSYLVRAIKQFKQGMRGTQFGDDTGAQMRDIALTLTDEEQINNVATYLAGLTPSENKPSNVKSDGKESTGVNLRRGSSLYQGNCGSCHGATAEGNENLNSPSLTGLDLAYLQRQMTYFQTGTRGFHPEDRFGKQMAMMSTTLRSDKDLRDVLAYILTL